MAGEITLKTKLLVRRDTAANLANHVLDAGEFGYATDSKVIKMGDGSTLFSALKSVAYAEDVTAAIKAAVEAAIGGLSVTENGTGAASKTITKIEETDGVFTVTYADIAIAQSQVAGLEAALAGKQAAGDYAAEVHTHVKADITDFAHTHIKSEITDFAHTHVASEITDLDTTIAAYDYATKTDAQGYADAKDEAIAAAKQAGDDAQDTIDAYIESNDAALAGVKATAEAATTVEEVDAQIDAKITALNLGTTYEPIGAETRAKAYADGLITNANLDQYTTEQEVKDIVDGVIAGAADSDTYNSLTKLVNYIDTHGGEAFEMAQAIDTLEGDVKGLKEAPSAGIKATDITAWNNEIGAKALAETKTTTAEVKDQIEAYGYATTGYADSKANDAKEAAIADAAEKYETKGTAQGIVDALKLGETYEPIGAETRATATAKTYVDEEIEKLALGTMSTKDTGDYLTKTETETELVKKLDANGWTSNDDKNGWIAGYAGSDKPQVALDPSKLEFYTNNADDCVTVTGSDIRIRNYDSTNGTTDLTINSREIAGIRYADIATKDDVANKDVGVTKIAAGTDIVVTPADGTGDVTVAHKEYASGAVAIKDKDGKDPTTPYFLNALTLTNGHVTGATAQSLAEALMSMTFTLDGGSATSAY